jgi:peroxiredoxin
LQSRYKELQARGVGLAAISYDTPGIMAAFSKAHGIEFPLLADPGSPTITRFGLRNPVPEMALGPNGNDPEVQKYVQKYVSLIRVSPDMVGVSFPGTFILDRQGRVTSRHFEDFYIERNTVSELMLKVGSKTAAVAGTRINTNHLEITAYPSDAAIAPGNRFAIALDIRPLKNMHVYAPGANGYKVIELSVDDQPWVRVAPLQYPPSTIYYFKPLNERVPVYQQPFTLSRDLVLEGIPQAQQALRGKDSLTITGTLNYQACNDRECFNPVSVPVSWKMSLRALVTERPPQTQH